MFSSEQIADLLSCRFGQLPECFPRPRVERGAFEADIAELQGSDCSRSELSWYGDVCIASRGVFATYFIHGDSPFQIFKKNHIVMATSPDSVFLSRCLSRRSPRPLKYSVSLSSSPGFRAIEGFWGESSSLIAFSAEPKSNHHSTTDQCLASVDIRIFTVLL